MERTVLPFAQLLEQEVQEWKKLRRTLRKEDQQFLARLFERRRFMFKVGLTPQGDGLLKLS